MSWKVRVLSLLGMLVAVGLTPLWLPAYELRVLNLALITSIAVIGLVFAFGYAGLIHLGQAAFIGIGAYASGLFARELGVGFWIAMPLSIAFGVLVSAIIGWPLLRLRGHYLALATIGFGVVFEIVAKNWTKVTGGYDGLIGIPPISVFGWTVDNDVQFFPVALAMTVVVALLAYAVRASRFGRAMIAVRDDELAAAVVGISVTRTKMLAFVIAGGCAALSGSLYAHYAGYVAPSDFDIVRAISVLAMLIVGGEMSVFGAILGSIVVSFAPEWLRFLGQGYLVAFSVILLAILVLAPQGIGGVVQQIASKLERRRRPRARAS